MEDIKDPFDEIPDSVGEPETAPEPTAPEASTEEAPPTPAVSYAALDALLPDAADVDEDLRGKPVAEVLRVARQHKEEAKRGYEASQKAKEAEFRARGLEAILAQIQQPQAPPPPSNDEILQQLAADPSGVIGEMVSRQLQPFLQQFQDLQRQNIASASENASERARAQLGIAPEAWQAVRPPIAAFMAANRLNIEDPSHWAYATNQFRESFQPLVPKPAVVERPAAPPGGQARSTTAAPQRRVRQMTARFQKELDVMAEAFGIKDKDGLAADINYDGRYS